MGCVDGRMQWARSSRKPGQNAVTSVLCMQQRETLALGCAQLWTLLVVKGTAQDCGSTWICLLVVPWQRGRLPRAASRRGSGKRVIGLVSPGFYRGQKESPANQIKLLNYGLAFFAVAESGLKQNKEIVSVLDCGAPWTKPVALLVKYKCGRIIEEARLICREKL